MALPKLLSLVAAALLAGACQSESSTTPAKDGSAKDGAGEQAPPPAADAGEQVVDGLVLLVPKEWTTRPTRGGMRKAEFALPGPGGEAELIVYRFRGGAGGGQANIDRWKGQVSGGEATDGTREVNGLKVAHVDVTGRYAGQSMPGAPPQPAIDDARLLAAAIEGQGDPYYLKLIGPRATVDSWAAAWERLLAGLDQR